MWSVSYFLRKKGKVEIALSVCGTQADGSPFTFDAEKVQEVSVGTKVVRGPDWKWAEQDGGEGSKGEIVDVKSNGWVLVKWQATEARTLTTDGELKTLTTWQ